MPHTTIADLLAKTLADAGVERIWGVTGDSLNGLSDSLRRLGRIDWMHVRHEEVAAFAQENSDFMIAFASVDPTRGAEAVQEAQRRLDAALDDAAAAPDPPPRAVVRTHAVLDLHRDMPQYRRQQQRGEWKALPVRPASQRRIGVLGLGKAQFGMVMFVTSLAYISGTFVCRRLLKRMTVQRAERANRFCKPLAPSSGERPVPSAELTDLELEWRVASR